MGSHATCGWNGTQVLLPMLTAAGRGDLALSILLQDTYPSLGQTLAISQNPVVLLFSFSLTNRLQHLFVYINKC